MGPEYSQTFSMESIHLDVLLYPIRACSSYAKPTPVRTRTYRFAYRIISLLCILAFPPSIFCISCVTWSVVVCFAIDLRERLRNLGISFVSLVSCMVTGIRIKCCEMGWSGWRWIMMTRLGPMDGVERYLYYFTPTLDPDLTRRIY